MKKIYTLDVNDSFCSLTLSQQDLNEKEVITLAYSNIKTKGFENNKITNIDEFLNCLKSLKNKFVKNLNIENLNVVVTIPSNSINLRNTVKTIEIPKKNTLITIKDYNELLKIMKSSYSTNEVIQLYILPTRFFLDSEAIDSLIGSQGKKATIEGTIVGVNKSILYPIANAIETAGFIIDDVIVETISDIYYCIPKIAYKGKNAILKFKNKTTDLIILENAQLKNKYEIDAGISNIIQEIKNVYAIDEDLAIKALTVFNGITHYKNEREKNYTINHFGKIINLSESVIHEIIANEIFKILNSVKDKIYNDETSVNKIILMGEITKINEINLLVEKVVGRPTEIMVQEVIGLDSQKLTNNIGTTLRELDKIDAEEIQSQDEDLNTAKVMHMNDVTKEKGNVWTRLMEKIFN